ncbi:hypothetical protein B1M_16955 [Burkholderia sp. TJI49]|nr:hypothetical protein B1M_16955 [Burkholderia sp. TJI49]
MPAIAPPITAQRHHSRAGVCRGEGEEEEDRFMKCTPDRQINVERA